MARYRTEQLSVGDSPMEVLVFEPPGRGPVPALLVAQHLPVAHAGLETDPFTLDVGERLAAAGYVAVIPFLFHWWPREQEMREKAAAWRDDWNIADLDATFELVLGMRVVDPDRIGVVGHCWGGRVAWMAACTNPRIAAAAMFYGGRIMTGLGPGARPAIEMAGQISCPILGIFGNDDQNPAPAEVDEIDRVLSAAGVEHEFHRYDGAGHGFQDFTNDERHRPEQTADAWARFFEFMDRHLGDRGK